MQKEKKTVNVMNVNSLVDKGLDAAERLAQPLGGAYGILEDPMGNGRGLSGAIPFMLDRLSKWKMPKDPIGMFKWAIQSGYYDAFTTGIMAAIVGYFLKEANLHPKITKVGSIAEKAGVSAAVGSAIGIALWIPAIVSSPPNPSKYTGTVSESYNYSAQQKGFVPSEYANGVLG